jgi:mycothiol synthase
MPGPERSGGAAAESGTIEVRVLAPRAPEEPEIARDLATIAERRDEHPAFGDAVWRDLDAGPERSRGLIAVEEPDIIGYVRAMARPDDDRTLDFALVVRPDHRDTDVPLRLLEAAIEHARGVDADAVTLWTFGADVDSDALAAAAGLEPQRELWQMRVPLPLAGAAHWPEGIVLRTFVPGEDDDAWLVVNNAAFVADPDQGGWTPSILAGRIAEPWFDPEGFLIADDAGAIAGFCWTKVHPPEPPHEPNALGEIYVIGVDPGHQGLGLGRALVLAGLEHLHDGRGIDVGMLFVDAANTPAVSLYRTLGFVTSRIDRGYGRALP